MIILVGLGLSGVSCLRYLRDHDTPYAQLPITVLDSRLKVPNQAQLQREFPELNLKLGPLNKAAFQEASRVILSPGMSHWAPQIRDWLGPYTPIQGDISLFAQALQARPTPVLGITGSNGKSTVTTLVAELLRAEGLSVKAGGNLGTPALDLLPRDGAWPDVFVLELSSFQLELIDTLALCLASILNVSPDHLDHYDGNYQDYINAKLRIFLNTEVIIANRDDSTLMSLLPKDRPWIQFGLAKPEHARDYGIQSIGEDAYLCRGNVPYLPVKKMNLHGKHNLSNALAALAFTEATLDRVGRRNPDDAPPPKALAALLAFKGLPHRCQWVRNHQGVQWINDSKGTNVGASVQALLGLKDTIPGQWILLAGGDGKSADFTPLLSAAKDTVKHAILFGKDKHLLAECLSPEIPCEIVNSLDDAVQEAANLARAGDGVLLSPACASWDQFKDYAARGEAYEALVKAL